MIDFISSDLSADPQTVACARLLAAVIARAIEDASDKQADIDDNLSAIDWLFDESSTFEDYAKLIGADARAIRRALLDPPSDIEPQKSRFSSGKRRHLRICYMKWLDRRVQKEEAVQKVMGIANDQK